MFNNKQKELREEQAEVRAKMATYEQEENYYTTASTVLNLAQLAIYFWLFNFYLNFQRFLSPLGWGCRVYKPFGQFGVRSHGL